MKKKKLIITAIAVAVCSVMALGLFFILSGRNKNELPDLGGEFTEQKSELSFSSQPSSAVKLSESSAAEMLSFIRQIEPEYKYADLYDIPQVKERLNFNATVTEHSSATLNKDNLTAEALAEQVLKNNEKYLKEATYKYKKVETDYINDICQLIVRIVSIMQQKHPDFDWNRVFCNLSNLKIVYRTGTLAFAQVGEDLALCVSNTNVTIADIKYGKTGYRNILIHEIMHILQVGCLCENIENCARRAGISVYWDDFPLNTADWTWLFEGSAERATCKITGEDATTYQYKMDYICSYNMALLLRETVEADTIENLCFRDDPSLLFDAFGCENEKQTDEVLKLMISTQILQSQPTKFYEVCKEKTGYDPNETEETLNEFGYGLKTDICISLAKEFYENLTHFTANNELSHNDLFLLINIFEGHLNQHLKYDNENQKEFNEPFFRQYNLLRTKFFDLLTKDNSQTDFASLYNDYSILSEGENQLNADLSVLPEAKKAFLIERAQWQKDNLGLGQKVPQYK